MPELHRLLLALSATIVLELIASSSIHGPCSPLSSLPQSSANLTEILTTPCLFRRLVEDRINPASKKMAQEEAQVRLTTCLLFDDYFAAGPSSSEDTRLRTAQADLDVSQE
ncbi:hypothetical protein GGR50DRAFT_679992 [Xylaria sp. CBS 124048]|nr:hypothetical protein GGR50DRAFT_679992 [Xylaria sp. CBS 124048]